MPGAVMPGAVMPGAATIYNHLQHHICWTMFVHCSVDSQSETSVAGKPRDGLYHSITESPPGRGGVAQFGDDHCLEDGVNCLGRYAVRFECTQCVKSL